MAKEKPPALSVQAFADHHGLQCGFCTPGILISVTAFLRDQPEPTDDEGCALQLLAMEIDYEPFMREVPLPAEVEIEQAHAEQRNGLLWISLPLKES